MERSLTNLKTTKINEQINVSEGNGVKGKVNAGKNLENLLN